MIFFFVSLSLIWMIVFSGFKWVCFFSLLGSNIWALCAEGVSEEWRAEKRRQKNNKFISPHPQLQPVCQLFPWWSPAVLDLVPTTVCAWQIEPQKYAWFNEYHFTNHLTKTNNENSILNFGYNVSYWCAKGMRQKVFEFYDVLCQSNFFIHNFCSMFNAHVNHSIGFGILWT